MVRWPMVILAIRAMVSTLGAHHHLKRWHQEVCCPDGYDPDNPQRRCKRTFSQCSSA